MKEIQQLQCHDSCPFKKTINGEVTRPCSSKFALKKQPCVTSVKNEARSYDNGASVRILNLKGIEIINVDPKSPHNVMLYKLAAVIDEGVVYELEESDFVDDQNSQ